MLHDEMIKNDKLCCVAMQTLILLPSDAFLTSFSPLITAGDDFYSAFIDHSSPREIREREKKRGLQSNFSLEMD